MILSLLVAALDLASLFSTPEAWQEKSEFFAVEHAKEGFQFASEERTQVNCLKKDACVYTAGNVQLNVYETKVYFDKSSEEEHITRVEISLYNRGDAQRTLAPEALETSVALLREHFAFPKSLASKKTTLRTGGTRYRLFHPKGKKPAEIQWGVSEKDANGKCHGEYLRLTLYNPSKAVKTAPAGVAREKRGTKIKENVTKSPNGDVYIANVPMVDQGQKGYCAAAVSERVLRYYGHTIDEHEIAQQAGTQAKGGTSVRRMREVITTVGEKNQLGYQNILSMSSGLGDLEEDLARYNKAAKAMKKGELSLDTFTHGNMIDVGELKAAQDPKVLYAVRKKDARAKKFSAAIRQQVNAGIPVFWGVTLGLYPERGVNPQTRGGHMRLIIGYNDRKKEILFTDTWGEGHELKRMGEDWAFTITDDAFILKPR